MVTENIYIKINMDILWSNIYIEVSKEIPHLWKVTTKFLDSHTGHFTIPLK